MDKSCFDITVFVINDGGQWEQKFRDAGIRVVNSFSFLTESKHPVIRARNYLRRKYIEHIRSRGGKNLLKAVLPAERFDMVISYNVFRMESAGIVKNACCIRYIHGDVATNDSFRYVIRKSQKLLPLYDKVICVSHIAQKSLQNLFGPLENTVVYHNPLNSERVRALSMVWQDGVPEEPYICAVGRLSPEKGYDRLVRIHKRLIDKGVVHKLVIVGDGPERENIEEVIRKTGTDKTVSLAGYRENPYPFMKNSLFLVCASYTEGLPVIAPEALSLGVPLVSSAPSVGELFGEQHCGIITEGDDVSLEQGIEKMLCDKEFYEKIKTSTQVRSHWFDGRRMTAMVEEEYLTTLKGSGKL